MKLSLRQFLGTKNKYILHSSAIDKRSHVGNKARNLAFLQKKGFLIPDTYVCTYRAYDEYHSGNLEVVNDLQGELENIIKTDGSYSVRSSANLEDAQDFSFAGQFETYLNIQGAEAILNAIQKIWNSASTDKIRTYRNQVLKERQKVQMAAIIQEMINPMFSGVVFTKNPLNGLDEVIVESVKGLGEALVQDGVTPDRWVYKWGDWISKPENQDAKFDIIEDIVVRARQIAKKYGRPVDLEWAYDGNDVYWLQLREITTLRNTKLYSNRISKEFLPGIIKPLIWSINIPVVNGSWKQLFEELIGEPAKRINVQNLARSFYYRAYFNMGVIGDILELLGMPREAIEIISGIEVLGDERPSFKPNAKSLRYLPRMLLFALKKSLYSKKIEKFLIRHKKKYDFFNAINLAELDEIQTLKHIDALFHANREASYVVIVTQMLMGFYNMILKQQLKNTEINFESLNFPTSEYLQAIDPRYYLADLHQKYRSLTPAQQNKIRTLSYQDLIGANEFMDFKNELKRFINRFGHLSDSGNDFSKTTWKENPDLVLQMVVDYSETKNTTSPTKENGDQLNQKLRKMPLRIFYNKAAKYREFRERVNFLYTYGYGLFRLYFLHLGKLFEEKGFINDQQDIFYLEFNEIRDIAQSPVNLAKYKQLIDLRKTEIQKYQNVALPELIYDDDPPESLNIDKTVKKLQGVATSKGYYIGRIKVIKGIQDFAKIESGDILTIPYSDVSWTPLFAKAKAVISESGGMLSHCSIVAREYNIPAVVAVKGAMNLKDETRVAVDGYNGEILILEPSKL